jgi:hypothetical protein
MALQQFLIAILSIRSIMVWLVLLVMYQSAEDAAE